MRNNLACKLLNLGCFFLSFFCNHKAIVLTVYEPLMLVECEAFCDLRLSGDLRSSQDWCADDVFSMKFLRKYSASAGLAGSL